ncbi:MAG: hypothetical protein LBT97_05960 [Planctomycetota bacterium]|nr:hypothetical protein [Planctomycetota bacterium]
MPGVPSVIKWISRSSQALLLVLLSCVVLAALLMLVFDELNYLEPTRLEKIIMVWHQSHLR